MEIPFYMLDKKVNNTRVAFIHGRPSGHPIHAAYAKAVNADFFHEDRILRWQDVKEASKIRRYLSWILNAFFFPNRNQYDVFLCECMRVPQLIMKKIGLMNKNQSLISLMADESLYFLNHKRYPKLTQWLIKQFLNTSDAIICIGDLQYEIALIYTKDTSKVHKIYNGLDSSILQQLREINHLNYQVKKMVVIGNLAANWRAWYKGVDLAIGAFVQLNNHSLKLIILGEVDETVKKELLSNVPDEFKVNIIFKGKTDDIVKELSDVQLCIHCSRGDAFPTSTLECFAAGIPVIASEDTGTKTFISCIDQNLVCKTNITSLKDAMQYYLDLPEDQKQQIGVQLKNHPQLMDSNHAANNFIRVFYKCLNL
jgi:glycosyltransferase involved in cell wall biosynthesis